MKWYWVFHWRRMWNKKHIWLLCKRRILYLQMCFLTPARAIQKQRHKFGLIYSSSTKQTFLIALLSPSLQPSIGSPILFCANSFPFCLRIKCEVMEQKQQQHLEWIGKQTNKEWTYGENRFCSVLESHAKAMCNERAEKNGKCLPHVQHHPRYQLSCLASRKKR